MGLFNSNKWSLLTPNMGTIYYNANIDANNTPYKFRADSFITYSINTYTESIQFLNPYQVTNDLSFMSITYL